MNIREAIDKFIAEIDSKFAYSIVWVEKDDEGYDIFHDRKYSDPRNQVFLDTIGELFYDLFIENGFDNVSFVYRDPLSAPIGTRYYNPDWTSELIGPFVSRRSDRLNQNYKDSFFVSHVDIHSAFFSCPQKKDTADNLPMKRGIYSFSTGNEKSSGKHDSMFDQMTKAA